MRTAARLTLAFAILAAGCGGATDPSAAARLRLAHARAVWQTHQLHAYHFDYTLQAMVGTPIPQPVRITVQADTVAHVVSLVNGAEGTANYPWPTVDTLFVRAEQALGDNDPPASITYDATLGYPTSISAPSRVPDVGWGISATNLAP